MTYSHSYCLRATLFCGLFWFDCLTFLLLDFNQTSAGGTYRNRNHLITMWSNVTQNNCFHSVRLQLLLWLQSLSVYLREYSHFLFHPQPQLGMQIVSSKNQWRINHSFIKLTKRVIVTYPDFSRFDFSFKAL